MKVEIPARMTGISIRAARLRAGLKQIELARMVGVHDGYISKIETGKRRPRPQLLKRIKGVLTTADTPIQGKNAFVQAHAFQNIVLQLKRSGTVKRFRKDLYWYMGWRLAWLIYRIGYSAFFQGLEDFALASERVRNTRSLPLLGDDHGVGKFYRLIQDKKRAQETE